MSIGRLVGVRPQDQLQCHCMVVSEADVEEGAIFDTVTTGLPAGKAIGWEAISTKSAMWSSTVIMPPHDWV